MFCNAAAWAAVGSRSCDLWCLPFGLPFVQKTFVNQSFFPAVRNGIHLFVDKSTTKRDSNQGRISSFEVKLSTQWDYFLICCFSDYQRLFNWRKSGERHSLKKCSTSRTEFDLQTIMPRVAILFQHKIPTRYQPKAWRYSRLENSMECRRSDSSLPLIFARDLGEMKVWFEIVNCYTLVKLIGWWGEILGFGFFLSPAREGPTEIQDSWECCVGQGRKSPWGVRWMENDKLLWWQQILSFQVYLCICGQGGQMHRERHVMSLLAYSKR